MIIVSCCRDKKKGEGQRSVAKEMWAGPILLSPHEKRPIPTNNIFMKTS